MRLRCLTFVMIAVCSVFGLAINVRAAEVHGGDDQSGEVAGAEHHVDYDQPPINPDGRMLQLFLFSALLFGGFVFAARKLAWAPLIEALDAREARVNQAKADAEAARADAERLLSDHQAKMAEVQEEVKTIVAKARTEAEQEKAKIIAEAEEQSQQMRESAIADIHAAREQALQQLTASMDDYVDLATEHVVGHKV